MKGVALVGASQNGAAKVSNVENPIAREQHHPTRWVTLGLQYAVVTIADANTFPAAIGSRGDRRTNHCIETGCITTASADSDTSNRLGHAELRGYDDAPQHTRSWPHYGPGFAFNIYTKHLLAKNRHFGYAAKQ
jgi:hypothetical protein